MLVNEALKSGAWRELVMEDQRVDEVLDTISTNYDLDEFITDQLELVFTTYTRGGTKKSKCYEMNKCLENLGHAQKRWRTSGNNNIGCAVVHAGSTG